MEDYFNKFTVINNKKEYQKKRLALTDSMLACFCFDKNDQNSNEILELLEGIKENFSSKIEIALLEKNSLEEAFRANIFPENSELFFFLICEPQNVDPTTLSLKNFDQFEFYKYFEEKKEFYETEFPIIKSKIFNRIKTILDSFPIVIFIKGTPFKPFCKYSKQFMELIRPLKIRYKSFDIFADDSLRTFLRLYSGWKTYPQIYINGKIIGGVDFLDGLIKSNEIHKLIPEQCTYGYAEKQLKETVSNGVVVFGRGKAENIEDDNTASIVKILAKYNIVFKYVDVHKDEMQAEILQKWNQVPFPQVFLNGNFFGGSNQIIDFEQKNSVFSKIPINLNSGFKEYIGLFKEKTIQIILLQENLEIVDLLFDLKEQNKDYDYITYKKGSQENLLNYVKNELKIGGEQYIVFKDLLVYKYD